MIVIPAGNASAWTGPTGTNTYLLEGAQATLVDAGTGGAAHLRAVEAALDGRPLTQVLLTHGHPDHAGGVPALVGRWPGVRVRNSPADPCRDGDVYLAGETTLRAIHTPGHAPDHFCFLDGRTRDLYCGDLVRLGGTIVVPARAGGNLTGYLGSLRRIAALEPRRLLPGHGPLVENPAALIDEYLRHRQEREQQILGVLGAGAASPEQIADRVYGTLPSPIVRAAAETVLAHLVKLKVEGRVREAPGGWCLV